MTKLIAGEVTDEHFNALVDATKISGERVISALYEHLVSGRRKIDSYQKHKVNMSQFSRRLKSLQKTSEAAESLAKFYR